MNKKYILASVTLYALSATTLGGCSKESEAPTSDPVVTPTAPVAVDANAEQEKSQAVQLQNDADNYIAEVAGTIIAAQDDTDPLKALEVKGVELSQNIAAATAAFKTEEAKSIGTDAQKRVDESVDKLKETISQVLEQQRIKQEAETKAREEQQRREAEEKARQAREAEEAERKAAEAEAANKAAEAEKARQAELEAEKARIAAEKAEAARKVAAAKAEAERKQREAAARRRELELANGLVQEASSLQIRVEELRVATVPHDSLEQWDRDIIDANSLASQADAMSQQFAAAEFQAAGAKSQSKRASDIAAAAAEGARNLAAALKAKADEVRSLPVPPVAINKVQAKYPNSARRDKIEGTTIVIMTIEADGAVSKASIRVSSGNRELDEAALEAAKQWSFRAASINGNPARSQVSIPFTFKLDG